MQTLRGHAPGFDRKMIDRRQRPAREEIAAETCQGDHQRQTQNEDLQHF
jgi:hypothetical protein